MEANKEVNLEVNAEETKQKYTYMFMCRHKKAERNQSIVNRIAENVTVFRNLGMVARK
jgi:hypothetical protein